MTAAAEAPAGPKIRELKGSPGSLGLYAKAAAPLIPGATALPWVGGSAKDIPSIELRREAVKVDVGELAAYSRVCGFRLAGWLPPTYPHILAFGMHMALMTDARFPFPAIGLVHVENSITQLRPIATGEALSLRVSPTPVAPHAKGKTFQIITEARVGDELVWESASTFLRRGRGNEGLKNAPKPPLPEAPPVSSTWRLPGDLGRKYAAVSGDRNPIHLYPLTAKLFGFPSAIAHGMWTKAACLAALEGRLPEAYTASVSFRKPIILPTSVTFGLVEDGSATRFGVRGKKKGTPHLDGTIEPTASSRGDRSTAK